MNVIFRTDASSLIGTGHVMRCLTLAGELRDAGARVAFISRELPGHLCDLVEREQGIAVHRLGPAPEAAGQGLAGERMDRLGMDWEQDAAESGEVLRGREAAPDWLVADHYGLDRRWEQRMRGHVRNILAIDDVADRPHACEVLLDQNLHSAPERRYAGLVPASCRLLLGPDYALLRREFREARGRGRTRTGAVKRILVDFGGSDHANATGRALEAIASLRRPEVAVDVVIGPSNPHRESLQARAASLPRVRTHHRVIRMAALMEHADLALGAGGATTWERCCVGLPALTLSIAPNQEALSRAAAEAGATVYLGRAGEVSGADLAGALARWIDDPGGLQRLSAHAMALVDGLGAERVMRRGIYGE
jgi:UDP-2,4-diacetamido-2,4,6-trideoxy-beta-L-altropyranose hydrolase